MAGTPKYAPVNTPIVDRHGNVTPIWRQYFTSVEPPIGGGITELTGDGTATGPGVVALTLAPSGVTPGSYISANITVDAKGRLTLAEDGSLGPGISTVLTADPASPADLTMWGVVTGVSPAQHLAIKFRIAGVTVIVAEITR